MSGAIPFVGLTGGLGAGKSTALRLLGELGAATISADAVVHELYLGEPLRSLVRERWGDGVVRSDGSIDRAKVAEHVFPDPAERKWLEAQIWPLVGQRIWEFRVASGAAADVDRTGAPRTTLDGAGAGGVTEAAPRAAVVETPLLFEAGLADMYDVTIAVIAPEEARQARAAARGHKAVSERDAAQLSQEEKAERADHVVVNDGTEEQLRDRLAAILDQLTG